MLVTSGAELSALTRPWTTDEVGRFVRVAGLAGCGASEYELVTTGMFVRTMCPRRVTTMWRWRSTTELRCTCVLELVRTARRTERAGVDAAAGGGASDLGALGAAPGVPICGKWASGIDRTGIAAGGAGASTSTRIAPAIIVT